jgi:hypothetical protein
MRILCFCSFLGLILAYVVRVANERYTTAARMARG